MAGPRIALAVGASLLLGLGGQATATDWFVSPGGSIQAAIDASSINDRILVSAGIYFEAIRFPGTRREVLGVDGAQVTILDATGLNRPTVQLDGSGHLAGFTVTGGSGLGGKGGGIRCVQGGLVEQCIVRGNSVTGDGGGISAGYTVIRDCEIADNTAGGNGGGVYLGTTPFADRGTWLRSCRIHGNHAQNGGGVFARGDAITITLCQIVENHATLAAPVHPGRDPARQPLHVQHRGISGHRSSVGAPGEEPAGHSVHDPVRSPRSGPPAVHHAARHPASERDFSATVNLAPQFPTGTGYLQALAGNQLTNSLQITIE